jgi:hypothetical protein
LQDNLLTLRLFCQRQTCSPILSALPGFNGHLRTCPVTFSLSE